ncbi:MAG: membrane integrity-associated transporter subunit PqiC [Novosphingobium sp.]|nr:membrane integrity-associated transporter subunit PqiC [Novosphingobium sp.]
MESANQRSVVLGRSALLLALSVALGGCLSFGAKPPPTLFRLTPASAPAAGAAVTGVVAEALVVVEPETDRRLGVDRVPVQINDSNVAYLKNAAWVERPARLFRDLLAETLRARGRVVFTADEEEAEGKRRLYGRLLDMGYDARQQAVVVRYDAVREGPGGTVATRRFEAVERGVAATPAAVGPALNRAANSVAAQVAAWVG